MNLRRQRPGDSLDMLLDTMCNTFGGIILLAVLVTLLTSRERHGGEGTVSDTQEMLQRRLAIAQTNLQQSLELQAALQTKANDGRWQSQVSLLEARQRLQNEIKGIRDLVAQGAQEIETSAGRDPAERMKELSAQLGAASSRKLAEQNSLAAAQENVRRLNTRLASLEKQAAELVKESERQLRLPKEHETGKRVVYIIVRYGRIYPCRNSDLSRNVTDIDWTSRATDEIAAPKRERGLDPMTRAADLSSYCRNLPTGLVYVAFLVYEDSFPAFIRARQIAVESGLAYGWEPYRPSDGDVSFGEVGHKPKPQ